MNGLAKWIWQWPGKGEEMGGNGNKLNFFRVRELNARNAATMAEEQRMQQMRQECNDENGVTFRF